jgi:hypothetical protein
VNEGDIIAKWFKRVKADKWARRHSFTEKEFVPYVKAIGQLLSAWNDLHERLSLLFVMALGAGWVSRPLAVWHSVRTDHSKRRMLLSALSELPEGEKAKRDKLISEIKWILDAADKLEGIRDDAAHTPLYHYPPLSSKKALTKLIASGVFADDTFNHPRAHTINQKKKNLLTEFEYARARAVALRDYTMAIDLAWGNAQLPWPDRPSLPEREPTNRFSRKRGR